jgi:hypothetical protein
MGNVKGGEFTSIFSCQNTNRNCCVENPPPPKDTCAGTLCAETICHL